METGYQPPLFEATISTRSTESWSALSCAAVPGTENSRPTLATTKVAISEAAAPNVTRLPRIGAQAPKSSNLQLICLSRSVMREVEISCSGNAETAGKSAHFFLGAPGLRREVLRQGTVAWGADKRGLLPGPALALAKACLMPFEIHDEGGYYFARLFGVLDRTDLNDAMAEIERLEDIIMKDRLTDLSAVEHIDVGF